MKHYWINIDECKFRYDFMTKQFKEQEIENYRISAETPSSISKYTIKKNEKSQSTHEEYSCILSHIKAIQKGYDYGDEYFCVMEDDVVIRKICFDKFINIIKDFEQKENEEIGIVQLYISSNQGIVELYNKFVETKQILSKRKEKIYPSAGYYLISRTYAKMLLDKLKINDMHFDLSQTDFCVADNILYMFGTTYILNYPIVVSNIDCGSILHPTHLIHHKNANDIIERIWKINDCFHIFN